jgi:hypothetical protein
VLSSKGETAEIDPPDLMTQSPIGGLISVTVVKIIAFVGVAESVAVGPYYPIVRYRSANVVLRVSL